MNTFYELNKKIRNIILSYMDEDYYKTKYIKIWKNFAMLENISNSGWFIFNGFIECQDFEYLLYLKLRDKFEAFQSNSYME